MTEKAEIVRMLDQASRHREQVIVATGVGSSQQITAREFFWDYPRRMLLTSAGHGTMGSGLPFAIAAAIEQPSAFVFCINGDGSMCMDMNHLTTIHEYELNNIKIVVLDDSSFGIVRQFDELQGYSTFVTAGRPNPDFAGIAQASGIQGFKIHDTLHWEVEAWRAFVDLDGPALAHCRVEDYAVWPIMEANKRPNQLTYEPPQP